MLEHICCTSYRMLKWCESQGCWSHKIELQTEWWYQIWAEFFFFHVHTHECDFVFGDWSNDTWWSWSTECVFTPFPKCWNAWKNSQLCGNPIHDMLLRSETSSCVIYCAFLSDSCLFMQSHLTVTKRCWHIFLNKRHPLFKNSSEPAFFGTGI